jgi:putative N6-adenine-specific DNA methylase
MPLWSERRSILITCARGVAPVLAGELRDLSFPVLSEGDAVVETEGTLSDTIPLNLSIRTGQRVLYFLKAFPAGNARDLYRAVSETAWEDLIDDDGYLSVTVTGDTTAVSDSRFAAVKTKDAIVDRIRECQGRRPDSGPDRHAAVVHLHWAGERARLYLDTSGEPLSRRGYRKIPLEAPMQETLAAAVLLTARWRGEGNLVNPMCGSGTLAIEGVLIALRRAPGLQRGNFGFMHIRGFDEGDYGKTRRRLKTSAEKTLKGRIIATDIRPEAVEAARQNARTAGVDHLIDFRVCDFRQTPVPGGGGVVILNPEYGERMGEISALESVYGAVGDFFKNRCRGYRGCIFTGNLGLAKKVGLRTSRRMPFYNGPIECRLLEYELYEGSHRRPKDPGPGPA